MLVDPVMSETIDEGVETAVGWCAGIDAVWGIGVEERGAETFNWGVEMDGVGLRLMWELVEPEMDVLELPAFATQRPRDLPEKLELAASDEAVGILVERDCGAECRRLARAAAKTLGEASAVI